MNLYIREKNKRYRPATDDEVLAETRVLADKIYAPKVKFTDPASTRQYISTRLVGLDREVFMGLFMNSQHELLEAVELAHGTIDAASVYPREVIKQALRTRAAAVIFAHNHPSGTPEPSTADRLLTDRLRQALQLIDVRVLDHFVTGGTNITSFAERGWL